MAIPAELAYFFRQPILRDAAYQLQVPSDRARLHRMAMEILEAMFDGPPPEPQLDRWGDLKSEPHPTDSVASDLAEHAYGVRIWAGDDDGSLLARELLYLRRAAEHAESKFDNVDAIALWKRLAETAEIGAAGAVAEPLRRAGAVLLKCGLAYEAEPLFERAKDLATRAGDLRTEGIALTNLAGVYVQTGRLGPSERIYELSLAALRKAGDRRTEGMSLGNLGIVYRLTGRVAEAERTYEQALAIHREVRNRRYEGIALANLAIVYRRSGRVKMAEQTYETALDIQRESGDRRAEGITLGNLAILYQWTERWPEAERTCEAALDIHREVGNRRSVGVALGALAELYRDTGRPKEAEGLYVQALAINREVGDQGSEGEHTCAYGLCLLVLKRAEARGIWQNGTRILGAIGDVTTLKERITEMREACAKAGVPPFDE